MGVCGRQWALVPVLGKVSTFSSASDAERDHSCGNGEQHRKACESGRCTDPPRYLAHHKQGDLD